MIALLVLAVALLPALSAAPLDEAGTPRPKVPIYQEVFFNDAYPGNVTHLVVAPDGSTYVAGLSPFNYLEYYEDDGGAGMHIFVGKFMGNQFLWITSIPNFGDPPVVYDIALVPSGFVLLGTFSSTLLVETESGDFEAFEPTGQKISVFVISFSDYHPRARWVNTIGVDWKHQSGPFSINAAGGYNDDLILVGNYFQHVSFAESELPVERGAQTFFVVIDEHGKNVNTFFTVHNLDGQCHEEPCQNGGTCEVNHFDEGFYCECPPGFEGGRCETVVEPQGAASEAAADEADYTVRYEDYEDQWTAPDEEWYGLKRRRGLGRERREGSPSLPKTRSVFTQTESFRDDDGRVFLYATGYTKGETTYSVFVHLYRVQADDVDLEWRMNFPSGEKHVFPSLVVIPTDDGRAAVAVAGTLSAPSQIAGFEFDFRASDARVIFVALLDASGHVSWTHTIRDIGPFHDEASLYIPITADCEFGGGRCDIMVAGPSTSRTNLGGVAIDEWNRYQYFLASMTGNGQANWVKELFPDTESGEIHAIDLSPSGNIMIGGSAAGTNVQFDFLPAANATSPTMLLAKVGYYDESPRVYDRYIAPIIYSEKQRPRLSFIFVFTFLVLVGVVLRMRFGGRRFS